VPAELPAAKTELPAYISRVLGNLRAMEPRKAPNTCSVEQEQAIGATVVLLRPTTTTRGQYMNQNQNQGNQQGGQQSDQKPGQKPGQQESGQPKPGQGGQQGGGQENQKPQNR
jgi:hypothetical protein